jgi:hypothetical protein
VGWSAKLNGTQTCYANYLELSDAHRKKVTALLPSALQKRLSAAVAFDKRLLGMAGIHTD